MTTIGTYGTVRLVVVTPNGVVAQLVEHLLCTQKVSRSSRVNSKQTKYRCPTALKEVPYMGYRNVGVYGR